MFPFTELWKQDAMRAEGDVRQGLSDSLSILQGGIHCLVAVRAQRLPADDKN